jgi:hypothetical protein
LNYTDPARLPTAVLDEYDLIGFDPRGVGASSPVTCDLPPAEQDLLEWPGPGGDISANVAMSKAAAYTANGCPNSTLAERGWLANHAIGVVDRFPDFAAPSARPNRPPTRLPEKAPPRHPACQPMPTEQ